MSWLSTILNWIAGWFRFRDTAAPESLPDPILRQSPNWSHRDDHPISMIVIHGDAGKTDEGTLSWCENPDSRVSYHYFIGRDGTLYQLVAEQHKAWHAGKSTWPNRTVENSVNPTSLGVCFANNGKGNEEYTAVQYETGRRLLRRLMSKYGIRKVDVVGHHDVSPGRKTDPWKWFDWDALWRAE